MAPRSQTLSRYLGYASFAAETFLLRRARPYLFILVINDKCNLDCFYCASKNTGQYDLDYAAVRSALSAAYARGHRALVITGGEPMVWQADGAQLHDVVSHARAIGFGDVAVFTNGTLPMHIEGVTYVVTIDGTRDAHNAIRLGTYDSILANVRDARAKVIASMTLSKANAHALEAAVSEITGTRLFSGITFNLLTHNLEVVAKHGLLGDERNQVLDRVRHLKQQGYPIILSRTAYRALRANSWKRPVKQIELFAGGRLFTCCRDVGNPDVCRNCGYMSCAEIAQAVKGMPGAIYQLLRTR